MLLVSVYTLLSLAACVPTSFADDETCQMSTRLVKNQLTKTSECGERIESWGKKVDDTFVRMATEIEKLASIVRDTREKQYQIARTVQYTACQKANSVYELTAVGGKRYHFHYKAMTWQRAKEFCEDKGMIMATPKTQSELSALHRTASYHASDKWWWTSATDEMHNRPGEFYWADGTRLYHSDDLWHSSNNEPDSYKKGVDVCAEFSPKTAAKLEDALCSDEDYVVCEVPPVCL
ncbi:uncharacterized protein LOC132197613 [Neocloeon triangulifer]|uniref:uncharacterized protein LOC132197613 n=1 Tax=Neocloeon triangulifer TaxID=2078957 RepID=UPI00286EF79B|nr:uncharacterized protein LOC132197613 [Neocloeon triangulifer]